VAVFLTQRRRCSSPAAGDIAALFSSRYAVRLNDCFVAVQRSMSVLAAGVSRWLCRRALLRDGPARFLAARWRQPRVTLRPGRHATAGAFRAAPATFRAALPRLLPLRIPLRWRRRGAQPRRALSRRRGRLPAFAAAGGAPTVVFPPGAAWERKGDAEEGRSGKGWWDRIYAEGRHLWR